jgi:hypothetical protein
MNHILAELYSVHIGAVFDARTMGIHQQNTIIYVFRCQGVIGLMGNMPIFKISEPKAGIYCTFFNVINWKINEHFEAAMR